MKIKFYYLILFLGFILSIYSCKKDGYSVTESGLRYHFYEKKKQAEPKLGDILKMHLSYRNAKDSILYDSKILGDSFLIELTKPCFKGGIEEGFAMMGEGDSASFLVIADSIFDKLFHLPLPDYLKKGEVLRFDVRLHKIMSREEMKTFLEGNKSKTGKSEIDLIHDYLSKNQLSDQQISEGVYFTNFIEGKGNQPRIGDEVSVKYIAHSLDGAIYDASENRGIPLKFTLGKGDYLIAFVNAIMQMKKGGVARVVLSSNNAYGSKTYGSIPANTPIVFELELIQIKANSNP